ncbi:high mobility group B protein 14 isoform X2 [Malania oleifera]|uniref:high mobility group B protein 14 isoform X2 n=1 Tax=Malania oleifera TaxID=397392 RepID=UPI0025AEB5EC|nr:high mobility group B protein 14 isoform X2 [Malania oleifera]
MELIELPLSPLPLSNPADSPGRNPNEMAKKAPKSQKSLPPSASAASGTSKIASHGTALKKKSAEKTKRVRQRSRVVENETIPGQVKKPKTKSKKKSKKVDAKKPKKPPTAFFYFLEDFRKVYQEKNPDVKSMRDIGKACGEKWKGMTYEEKVQYYDIATEKRAEFDRAMADYIKRKESGEDQESDCSEY